MSDLSDMTRMYTSARLPYILKEFDDSWVTRKAICINSVSGDRPTQFSFDVHGRLISISWSLFFPKAKIETMYNF